MFLNNCTQSNVLGINFGNIKKSTKSEKYQNIDSTLLIGAKPNTIEFRELKNMDVDTIIDCTTGCDLKDKDSKKEIAKSLGIKYVNLPFQSFENSSKEFMDNFFQLTGQARKNNEKVYLHCGERKDITGLLAATYKVKYNLADLPTCIQEMLNMSQDNIDNANHVSFLKKFYYNQQPNLNQQPNCYINKSKINASDKNTELFVNKFLNSQNPVEMTQILLERYPELYWLTGDVSATPERQTSTRSNSISEQMFGKKHIEFDRTIVGIECMKHVINGDYDKFTECQNEAVKMTPENFQKLRDFTLSVIKTPQDADTILAFTMINDLGKIKEFSENIEKQTQRKIKDHDEALLIALKTIPDKIPSFNRLSKVDQTDIINALDADFNLGQFVQGECLPANLSKVKTIENRAMDLYLAHMFYDVAGAAGHVAPNGSLVMNNNVFNSYMQGIDSIKENISKGEKETYDSLLSKKAQDYNLPFETNKEKAMVRLCLMSRAYTPKDASEILKSFSNLSLTEQENLLDGLSRDGINKKGILLYYSPAFIQNAINAKPENKEEMLTKAYNIISKIYANHLNENNEESVKIVSLANIANIIRTNPDLSAEELYSML